jgi:hypothetical protein
VEEQMRGAVTPWTLLVAMALAGAHGSCARASSQDHHHPAPPAVAQGAGYTDMGPHMRVTVKRAPRPDDTGRAQRLVERTRAVMARYKDHQKAVDDGYRPFLAQLPLPEYHFTNYWHGFKANFSFDVEQPTSVLYVKEGGGYRLTGVMFTAGAGASLDELDSRVPLSLAQWHLHTSLCLPPKGRGIEMLGKDARFGFQGTIATREECDAAGGRFFPRMFGWMVHVYPDEKRLEDAFRMPAHHDHQGERDPAGHAGHGAHGHAEKP